MGLNKIKKIIGFPVRVRPIVDYQQYETNGNSYTGGSLHNKNILVVSDFLNTVNEVVKDLDKESVNYSFLSISDGIIQETEIRRLAGEKVGPYTNLINLFMISSCDENAIYKIYNSLQCEVSYLVDNKIHGFLTTGLIYNVESSISDKSSIQGLKGLIEGLGTKLPNHGITCNGIIAENRVPLSAIMNTLLYMNSKYGCVLNGEVMELKE